MNLGSYPDKPKKKKEVSVDNPSIDDRIGDLEKDYTNTVTTGPKHQNPWLQGAFMALQAMAHIANPEDQRPIQWLGQAKYQYKLDDIKRKLGPLYDTRNMQQGLPDPQHAHVSQAAPITSSQEHGGSVAPPAQSAQSQALPQSPSTVIARYRVPDSSIRASSSTLSGSDYDTYDDNIGYRPTSRLRSRGLYKDRQGSRASTFPPNPDPLKIYQ